MIVQVLLVIGDQADAGVVLAGQLFCGARAVR